MIYAPIAVTAATLTLRKDNHAGAIVVGKRAAGQAYTLPASSGGGAKYSIYIGTTITSNTTTIKVANSTDVMKGLAMQAADGGATLNAWETAADSDTITFDGSTTGGIVGDLVELTDVESGIWLVRVTGAATGTEATPFSATV